MPALFDLAPIVEITREDYDRLFDINVAGTLFTLQAGARSMIARGKGGKIINMASQAGRRGEPLVVRLLRDQGGGDQPDPVGRARPDRSTASM
jgi:NAD(P)-dependent dehydrogenase (short-subunit alcohol dehydrogenase family)